MKLKAAVICVMVAAPLSVFASSWTYSGYAEGFYSHGSAALTGPKSYPFVYSYPDNQNARLNHAQIEFKARSDDWFGTLGLHTGRYVEENYAAEPSGLRPIYSASIGKSFGAAWTVEAGVFGSHIGYESAIGKDGLTLSRSLVADNSPYFETGVKVTYAENDKWSFTGLVLNGWQNISDANTSKAIGTQIQWKPSAEVLLNSSTFIGNEQLDSAPAKMRYFHNFFATIGAGDQWLFVPMADIGVQENGAGGWDSWGGAALLAQYRFQKSLRFGGRIEFFSDPAQVVTAGAESVKSASINADYDVMPNLLWRNEVKTVWGTVVSNTSLTTAVSIAFDGKGGF